MLVFPFVRGQSADSRFDDCLMLFLGLDSPDIEVLDNVFDHWTDSNVPPPMIVVVGEKDALISMRQGNLTPQGRVKGLDRLYKHSEVEFAGFDNSGTVKLLSICDHSADITDIFNDAVSAYIQQQIQDTDVVIPAPPSIFFDKLSGRYSSHFIRSEALLQCTSSIELLALRLLKPFNDWHKNFEIATSDVIDIYLDTMSIWPVAERLTQLHRIGNAHPPRYRIESFKSYGGLEKWDPQDRAAFIIISATTSGGLSAKIRKKLTGDYAEIWTLLTLAPVQSELNEVTPSHSNHIFELQRGLVGRPALDGLRGEFETEIDPLPADAETISIVGERFLNQPVKPKRVRLVHLSLSQELKQQLPFIAAHQMIVAAQSRYDAQSRWSLSFNIPRLVDSVLQQDTKSESPLSAYLREEKFSSTTVVIYPSPDGTGSPDLAQAVHDFALKVKDAIEHIFTSTKCIILASDQLANEESDVLKSLASGWSAIIAAPVIGNGFVFKQISALLRTSQPNGKRLFLAIAALPEAKSIYDQLVNDVTLVDKESYHFKCFYPIPIGRLDTVIPWNRELDVLNELQKEMDEKAVKCARLTNRAASLEQFDALPGENVFLPTAKGDPLPLSRTFALWENSAGIEGNAYGGDVLLSVAAFLQATRAATKKDETSLKTGLFQHALICPESFTRYNDGIIQAAILRAAYASELNYSVSPEMSHDMKRLMLKWFQYAEHPAGAAAGEFLLAMAVRKLRLRDEDSQAVINCAKGVAGWIGCLAHVTEKHLAVVNSEKHLAAVASLADATEEHGSSTRRGRWKSAVAFLFPRILNGQHGPQAPSAEISTLDGNERHK